MSLRGGKKGSGVVFSLHNFLKDKKRLPTPFFIIVCLFFPALAAAVEVPRKILALYDPRVYHDVVHTNIHRAAEMPLNYLGLEVIYRPVGEPWPSEEEMAGVRGILTWFQDLNAVPEPRGYCLWLSTQMAVGRRVVILEEPGFFKDKRRRIIPECQEAMETLGARYLGEYADNPFYFDIVRKDEERIEFERRLVLTEGQVYSHFKVSDPGAHVFLVVRRLDLDDSDSALVWTTSRGGFAHPTYVLYRNEEIGKQQWRLNPFLFFEEAYDLRGLPRPDVTTANGRRIFYSHIDGDGIFNLSHIDRKSLAGEVIAEKILKKYPTIPITVSIIAGYLDMREYVSPRTLALYKALFELPNVEPAAHGYAHPLVWKTGKAALRIPGYRYNPETEVKGAVQKVRDLLKRLGIPKDVALYQWTGDCELSGEMIALAVRGGFPNMNGGDHRWDGVRDSASFYGPFAVVKEGVRQVYASASNENVYTNLWEGPYFGFRDVVQTFDRTESPRRVAPINLYYHFYSGERVASLKALTQAYDNVLARPILAMRASHYARMVEDFFRTKIEPLADGGWRLTETGSLRTVRFEGESRYPDLNRSTGVIGYRHERGSLYLFLGEGSAHDIFLSKSRFLRPHVTWASFAINNFRGNASRLSFSKRGWFKSEARLGGMAPRRAYRIRAGDEVLKNRSDERGELSLKFSSSEGDGPGVEVVIEAE